MKIFVRTYLTRFVVLVVAFQVLNMSVHGGDFGRNYMLQDVKSIGSYNQIDCFGEYMCEVVLELDIKYLFPDNELHNHGKGHIAIFKSIDIKQPTLPFRIVAPHENYIPVVHYMPLRITYDYLFSQEITPPPPKRA